MQMRSVLRKLVPSRLKPSLLRLYFGLRQSSFGRTLFNRPKSREQLLEYWKNPWDGRNLPQSLLEGHERSVFLLHLVQQYTQPGASVMEIGCNAGRNLHYLFEAGITNLSAVEVSEEAIKLLRSTYPEMASQITIFNAPAEDLFPSFPENSTELIYTMAVLEHIHKDSEWLFNEIARVARTTVITIEDEQHVSWRHFPRNYRSVFESLGLTQVIEHDCTDISGLGTGFVARVFQKQRGV